MIFFLVYLLPQFRLSVIIKYQIDTCSPEEAQAKQTQLKSSLCDQNVDCEFTHVTAHCYLFVEEVSNFRRIIRFCPLQGTTETANKHYVNSLVTTRSEM